MVVRIPLDKAKAGMRLAQPLYHEYVILLRADQCLTSAQLERLDRWQVKDLAVYL